MSEQISVQCPKCGARLKLKNRDSLGKKLPCPKCQEPFLVKLFNEPQTDSDFVSAPESIEAGYAVPDDDDEAPQRAPAPRRSSASQEEKPHKRSKSTGWQKPALVVGSGLLGVALMVGLVWTAVSVFSGGANKQQADSTSNSSTPGVTNVATTPSTTPVAAISGSATPSVPGGMAASQPRLPDAVTQAPAWLVGHAPFDVVKYFDVPPPDQNAAPLYLDAIAEFEDVGHCFPTDQQQTQRFQAVKERDQRYNTLSQQPRTAQTAAQWDELLRDYDIGFQKLTLAQQKPKCVFETGVGPLALLLHVHAGRHVVRMADERVRRDLEHGNFDRPLQIIEMCLRLSLDLRPRGGEISQLVSVAMDGIILEAMVGRVITTLDVKPEHCDRLLAMLHEHDQQSQNLHLESGQGVYIGQRVTLRDIQDPAARRKIKEDLGGDDDSAGAILLAMTDNYSMFSSDGKVDGLASNRFAASFQKANELLASLDERQEIAAFDEQYRTVVALGQKPHREREAGWSQYETTFKETAAREMKLLVTRATMVNWGRVFEAFTRSATKRHGTQALVALRRWQLTHTEPPRDLAQIMADADLNAIPRDDYADAPLKLATLKGQPLIYSIGPDGKDDAGAVEWNSSVPKGPGDVLFQLTPPK